MRAVVCDKCNKVLTGRDVLRNTTEVEISTQDTGVTTSLHLCDDCHDLLFEWIDEKIKR